MLTAEEARKIANVKQQHLDFILNKIRTSAEKQEFEVIIRDMPYERWLYNTPAPGSVEDQVIVQLKTLGYKVSLYYNTL